MGDQDCLASMAGARILTINGQTIMVNGNALKIDGMGGTDLFSVLQSADEASVLQPQGVSADNLLEMQEDPDGGFLLYYDNDASELQSMQITPDQVAALGLADASEVHVQQPPAPPHQVLSEPPPLAVLDKGMNKQPVTFSIRLNTNTPKSRPPPLHIVSGPLIPPPGKVAIPRPSEEARIIRTNPTAAARSSKVIPRILATPTTALPVTPPLIPFSKTVLKVNQSQEPAKVLQAAPKQVKIQSKPLGSSENPIQLVQHGPTYHSLQQLNQEQLKQISTVLHNKQIDTTKNTKNVLYDESTNTRIIYRFICPENQEPKKTAAEKPPPKKRGRPSKVKKASDDEDYTESDISKGEKEERKKLIPRTRSGRLSRPPRHMVKDYKRIHHLDFAEPDLDDSDGGYSDYQISDSELGPPEGPLTENSAPTNAVAPKLINSRFRCPTCHKIYLGYKRLTQHFTQYPEHGSIDAIPQQMPTDHVKMKHLKKKKMPKKQTANAETRNKIKKILANCEPSEVVEIAASAVANSMDLWEMLLLKVSVNKGTGTRTEAMLKELDSLLEKAKENLTSIILNTPTSEDVDELKEITITDTPAAIALNAPCGVFKVLRSEDEKLSWQPPRSEDVAETPPPPDTITEAAEPKNENDLTTQPDSLGSPLKEEALGLVHAEEPIDPFELPVPMETEKPSDTSLLSDTPLDEIVSAELNNLVSKSGISDFVNPPDPTALVTGNIFGDESFHSAVKMQLGQAKEDLIDHEAFDDPHSLDQAPHEVDFEALSEEFNRNTQA